MKEIVPGIHHWTAVHPKLKIVVSSYYLPDERILIDPLIPADGLKVFQRGVQHILLTNRHHYRQSGEIQGAFGCAIWCVETGMHEFTQGEKVRPFKFGDSLPGGIEPIEIGALCPDETALFLLKGARRKSGAIALADGAVREDRGPLAFVPDEYMGEDPAKVKAGLKESYRRLLNRSFDTLLLAHGLPIVGRGREALRALIES